MSLLWAMSNLSIANSKYYVMWPNESKQNEQIKWTTKKKRNKNNIWIYHILRSDRMFHIELYAKYHAGRNTCIHGLPLIMIDCSLCMRVIVTQKCTLNTAQSITFHFYVDKLRLINRWRRCWLCSRTKMCLRLNLKGERENNVKNE